MENNEDKKVTQYLIPANVTTKFEFFPGFGWYEFKIVLSACIIGTIFFFLLGVPQKTIPITVTKTVVIEDQPLPKTTLEIEDKKVPYIPVIIRILFIAIPGSVSFFAVKRDSSSGMSCITLIRSRQEYMKKQKKYLDIYGSATEGKK